MLGAQWLDCVVTPSVRFGLVRQWHAAPILDPEGIHSTTSAPTAATMEALRRLDHVGVALGVGLGAASVLACNASGGAKSDLANFVHTGKKVRARPRARRMQEAVELLPCAAAS